MADHAYDTLLAHAHTKLRAWYPEHTLDRSNPKIDTLVHNFAMEGLMASGYSISHHRFPDVYAGVESAIIDELDTFPHHASLKAFTHDKILQIESAQAASRPA